MDALTTARIAAFIPGASPPEVNTPSLEIVMLMFKKSPKNKTMPVVYNKVLECLGFQPFEIVD